jgi:hypothetical protein
MAITTRVQFGRQVTNEEKTIIDASAADAKVAGTTDNNPVIENPESAANHLLVRTWTTVDAANAWITFVNTFTPPPASAEVIEE